jgi:hypothetical protein
MSRDELSTRLKTTHQNTKKIYHTIITIKIAEALMLIKRIVCSNQRQCNISDGSGEA